MKFLLNPLVPGAQSGLVDGYIGPNTARLKGKLQANVPLYEGQEAPFAAHALIRFPNSACVPGAGARPLPGDQAQPTSESSDM